MPAFTVHWFGGFLKCITWYDKIKPSLYAKKEYMGMHVQLQSFLTLALSVVELPASQPGCFTHWTPVVRLMSQSAFCYRYDVNRWQMLSYIAVLIRFTFLMQESSAPAQRWKFQHLTLVESMNIHYIRSCWPVFTYSITSFTSVNC
jgi:hypothetical protein